MINCLQFVRVSCCRRRLCYKILVTTVIYWCVVYASRWNTVPSSEPILEVPCSIRPQFSYGHLLRAMFLCPECGYVCHLRDCTADLTEKP